MKACLTLLLCLGFYLVQSTQAQAQTYAPAESKQSIEFPAAFTEETTEGEAQKTSKATCEVEGQTFYFGYTIHEVELEDHQELAQISLDSFLKVIDGKMITQWEWELDGNYGLKAVFIFGEGTLVMEYRTILKGQIQYQALVYAPINGYNNESADAFFNSFQLLD